MVWQGSPFIKYNLGALKTGSVIFPLMPISFLAGTLGNQILFNAYYSQLFTFAFFTGDWLLLQNLGMFSLNLGRRLLSLAAFSQHLKRWLTLKSDAQKNEYNSWDTFLIYLFSKSKPFKRFVSFFKVYGQDSDLRAVPIARSPVKLAFTTSQNLNKVNICVRSG